MTSPVLMHPRVAVISDIHLGDPTLPNLEDFACDAEFEHLLTSRVPARLGAPVSLVIAGDFIDFPQVLPEIARHAHGDRYGTTEAESLRRFERVLAGHPRVFAALARFLRDGGQVCLLAGNHDPDYHWPGVEAAMRTALGDPPRPQFTFVANGAIHERGVYIEHGNQYSFDNRFDAWPRPILDAPDGLRLERPWGTLFMDMVYNDAEEAHPFLNRIYPHDALAAIVARSLVGGQASIRLIARIVAFLARKGGRLAWEHLLGDDAAPAADITTLARTLAPQLDDVDLSTVARLARTELIASGSQSQSTALPGLLGRNDERGMTRRATELLVHGEATIVVFGHTHVLVDHAPFGADDPRRVFNTGSWMPRLDVEGLPRPTFRDLAPLELTGHELRFLAIELSDPPRASLEVVE